MFSVKPGALVRYRVEAKAKPAINSAHVEIRVKALVTLAVSDKTPDKGDLVKFSGHVAPQHDGQLVAIQRRRADGSWKTVKRTKLRDDGTVRSRYARSLEINKSGVYRNEVVRGRRHLSGRSKKVRVTVG